MKVIGKLAVKICWFAQLLLCFLISIVAPMVKVEKIINNGIEYTMGSSGGGGDQSTYFGKLLGGEKAKIVATGNVYTGDYYVLGDSLIIHTTNGMMQQISIFDKDYNMIMGKKDLANTYDHSVNYYLVDDENFAVVHNREGSSSKAYHLMIFNMNTGLVSDTDYGNTAPDVSSYTTFPGWQDISPYAFNISGSFLYLYDASNNI